MTPEAIEAGKWYHYHKKLADYYAKHESTFVLAIHHRRQQVKFRTTITNKGWEEVLTDQGIIDEIYRENGRAPEVNKGAYGDRGNE